MTSSSWQSLLLEVTRASLVITFGFHDFHYFDVSTKIANTNTACHPLFPSRWFVIRGIWHCYIRLARFILSLSPKRESCWRVADCQVDEWLEYAPILSNGAEFERACAYIDSYLSLRTFMAGYDVTIADVAIWTALGGRMEQQQQQDLGGIIHSKYSYFLSASL